MPQLHLPREDVAEELAAVRQRAHYLAQAPDIPLGFLSARQFELFAHGLLGAAAHASGWYDSVQILPEGSDAGVDVQMLAGGRLVGVAQCKRYKCRISLPLVLAEIFKFLMFAFEDGRLPDAGFRYEFWTAQDVASTTAAFFADPAKTLAKLSDQEVALALDRVSKDVPTLKLPDDRPGRDRLRSWAQDLKIHHVSPARIAELAAAAPKIRAMFFRGPDDRTGELDIDHVTRQLAARRDEQREGSSNPGDDLDRYEASAALAESFEAFLAHDQELFVLSGGSGRGKTTWSARLLQRQPSAYEVVLIRGEEIGSEDNDVVDTLARQLSRRPDSSSDREATQRAVWSWLDIGNRIFVIDGLDRVSSPARETLYSWIDATAAQLRRRATRLILTTRPEIWLGISRQLDDRTRQEIFRPVGEADGPHDLSTSHRLVLLSDDEAAALYGAYRLPPKLHCRFRADAATHSGMMPPPYSEIIPPPHSDLMPPP